jgi:histidinol-phosphatase
VTDPSEYLAFARELADEADRHTLARFGGAVPATTKPDGSPVTEADQAAEAALADLIAAEYPDHAVLGEESGGSIDPNRPTWVLDPIDGTKNYMRGIPVYATLIGLVVDGAVVVGVASAPALGERWDAAVGRGTRMNGRAVGVSAIADLGDAHVLHGGLDWYRKDAETWAMLGELSDRCWRTRGFGDFWSHLMVAGGMAEVALASELKPWDIAALECIVGEAGGRLTSWDGGPALESGEALTTNGAIHDEMQRFLADHLH